MEDRESQGTGTGVVVGGRRHRCLARQKREAGMVRERVEA